MIYCFDLDGTLCSNELDYQDAKPIEERIKQVNKLYEEGHTILIDSGRGSITGEKWYRRTLRQLQSWGVKFHKLRVGTKFAADVYVDDKGKSDLDFFK